MNKLMNTLKNSPRLYMTIGAISGIAGFCIGYGSHTLYSGLEADSAPGVVVGAALVIEGAIFLAGLAVWLVKSSKTARPHRAESPSKAPGGSRYPWRS